MTLQIDGEIGEAFSSVLSYYSSQLTSHSAMMAGFIVAFFTLIQLKVPPFFFQFVATTLVSIEVYLLLRVVLYAGLSSVLLNTEQSKFDQFHPDLLPTARVNQFASERLRQVTSVRRLVMARRVFENANNGRRVNAWIPPQMIASAFVGILVDGVIFGGSDLLDFAFASGTLLGLAFFTNFFCWVIACRRPMFLEKFGSLLRKLRRSLARLPF